MSIEPQEKVDVAIIGAGVVGLFIARELSRYELKIMVIEKEPDAGWGATKGNAGIIHAFQLPFNSLKGRLCLEGNKMYDEISKELEVPFKRLGLLLVSINALESLMLPFVYLYFKLKGIEVHLIRNVRKIEPNLNEKASMALYFPTAGVVSVFDLVNALVENCRENGVTFSFNRKVSGIEEKKEGYIIYTDKGSVEASWVINAAGVHADEISRMAGYGGFTIYPRKGTLLILAGKRLYNHLLAEMPLKTDPKTKGGGALLTFDGKMLLGPNLIEKVSDKEDKSSAPGDFDDIIKKYQRLIPALAKVDPLVIYTGLREASNTNDFIINIPKKGFMNVAGIQSPGLTAAPAIARVVVKMLSEKGLILKEKRDFVSQRKKRKKVKELLDDINAIEELVGKEPDYGEIICPCELVSKAEIANAIKEGHNTIDGIKFHTGSCMGECQGSYCLVRILDAFTELGLEEVTKKGEGSWIVRRVEG